VRRREFIGLLGGAATWQLSARAQQPPPVRRVSVLMAFGEDDDEAQSWARALREGLQKLGSGQGRDVRIEYYWATSDVNRLNALASELVSLQPDVIFAGATPALVALMRETRSIPIVFVQVSDPVRLGYVTSLARPGGNITGFANFEHAIGGKWLELIKDTAPGITRVAVIFDPNNPSVG
jgi:putative tryptophan/tyrosine transport system substrate-binding protein